MTTLADIPVQMGEISWGPLLGEELQEISDY